MVTIRLMAAVLIIFSSAEASMMKVAGAVVHAQKMSVRTFSSKSSFSRNVRIGTVVKTVLVLPLVGIAGYGLYTGYRFFSIANDIGQELEKECKKRQEFNKELATLRRRELERTFERDKKKQGEPSLLDQSSDYGVGLVLEPGLR